MRRKSHKMLGNYLVSHYMQDTPKRYIRAFLIGCIQPDRNPTTYFKGSLHHQWLRGHNYPNARRFMGRIAFRLETKKRWNLFDYYTLGKLIHYTADAFTYAHNNTFSANLEEHMQYEVDLQNHFLDYLQNTPPVEQQQTRTIMQAISKYHNEYLQQPADISRDSHFALHASCCVLAILYMKF